MKSLELSRGPSSPPPASFPVDGLFSAWRAAPPPVLASPGRPRSTVAEPSRAGPCAGPESRQLAVGWTDGGLRPEPSPLKVTGPLLGSRAGRALRARPGPRPPEDAAGPAPTSGSADPGVGVGFGRRERDTDTPSSVNPLGRSGPCPGARGPADSFLVAAVAAPGLAPHFLPRLWGGRSLPPAGILASLLGCDGQCKIYCFHPPEPLEVLVGLGREGPPQRSQTHYFPLSSVRPPTSPPFAQNIGID